METELLKNRTHQTYRWKPLAIAQDKESAKVYLEELIKADGEYHRDDYRIVEYCPYFKE